MALEDFATVKRCKVEDKLSAGDVLIKRVGSRAGEPVFIPEETELTEGLLKKNGMVTPQNCIHVSLNEYGKKVLVPEYLYYVLLRLSNAGYFEQRLRGTAQQFITIRDVKNIPILAFETK